MEQSRASLNYSGPDYWVGKWNYSFFLKNKNKLPPEIRKNVMQILRAVPAIDDFASDYLEENSWETEYIQAFIYASQSFLQELSLPPVPLDSENVHLVSYRDFVSEVIEFYHDHGGAAWQGHAYIPRLSDRAQFVNLLAHQLAHLCSFYAVFCLVTPRNAGGYLAWEMQTRLRQSGFFKVVAKRWIFLGFNEGVTEMFACEIKKRFFSYYPNLSFKEKALSSFFYWPHVVLIETMIKAMARNEKERNKLLREMFFTYVTGQKIFLKKVKQRLPHFLPYLARLGLDFEQAKSLTAILKIFSLCQ